ncbi:MAG TPA: c-type cytochrome [Saprospiraceae bacterium]|nr:c-type cytochrome [Saprospiraceae bacterium]
MQSTSSFTRYLPLRSILFLYTLLFSLLILISACQPPTDIPFDTSTDEFILKPGFAIQTVAAEPLLDSPMAFSFDKKGRIWVVELPGYMRDIDGSEQQRPDGKVVLLEDTNQDGYMDKRSVILDQLEAPRAILHAYGGLMYSDGTELWWARLDDTRVTEKVLVDSLYVVGGNIEHQPNGLLYNLDNWIYSAKSNARYRYQGGQWLREATTSRGQWGLSNDTQGRLYYNNNSVSVMADLMMPNLLIQNPYQKVKKGLKQNIGTSNRLYAYQATAVNRGYQDGVLDEEGKIKNFTSACSPLVFTGDGLGEGFHQDVFVCGPEGNLVKRYHLQEKEGLTQAVPAYDSTEFLVSKEETFRPVNLYNGPDGALYILDLRKGVIQHRAYMTSYLRKQILNRGLDSINGLGRIYRVVAEEHLEAKARDFSQMSTTELSDLLASQLAYERNFAQQELVYRQEKSIVPLLEALALQSDQPYAQLHALWTLEGLDAFSESLWLQMIEMDNEPLIVAQLIRFSGFLAKAPTESDLLAQQMAFFQKAVRADHPLVLRHLALRLGQIPGEEALALLVELIGQRPGDPVLREAAISGIGGQEARVFAALPANAPLPTFQNQLQQVMINRKAGEKKGPKLAQQTYKDNRTAGFNLFNTYCSSCHGLDGMGKDQLAPPLLNSEYVGGSKDRLILLTLNGLYGPITVNGKRYEMNAVMPGIKNNPELSDKDIADLLIFLRNSFSFSSTYISEADVARWRVATRDREELFTEEELKQYE